MSSISVEFEEYYGLKDMKEIPKNPRDIDSDAFDSKLLYMEYLKKLSIHQLAAKENSLLSEISSLGSDLQSLIYDNYSKFLGASQNVKEFGANIDTLTVQMNGLESTLSNVAKNSDTINQNLKGTKDKIQRLVGIQRLLERVQFISKLPKMFRHYLKTKKYSQAVDVWTKVEKILKNQQQYPSFAKIYEECTMLVKDLNEQIQEEMLRIDVPIDASMQYGILLVRLGSPLSLVCSQLVHHGFLVVDNAIDSIQLPEEPYAVLIKLNEDIINDATKFVQIYRTKLMILADNHNLEKVDGILSDFTTNFFNRLQPLLPVTNLYTFDGKRLSAYLKLFIDLLSPICTKEIVLQHTHYIFKKYAEARVEPIITKIKESFETKSDKDAINSIAPLYSSLIENLANDFSIFEQVEYREPAQYLIQNVSLITCSVLEYFLTTHADRSLVAAVICRNLVRSGISTAFGSLSKLSSTTPTRQMSIDLERRASDVSDRSLWRFIQHRRKSLEAAITEAMCENKWRTTKEAKEVSAWCKLLLARLNEEWIYIGQILGASDENQSTGGSSEMSGRRYSSNMPSFEGVREEDFHQIERLFASVNRLDLGKRPPMERPQVFTSIAMFVLKSVLENVRNEVISCQGFNQVQVDMYALYNALKDRMTRPDVFSATVEEIVLSAADRAYEAVPLKTPVLISICN